MIKPEYYVIIEKKQINSVSGLITGRDGLTEEDGGNL